MVSSKKVANAMSGKTARACDNCIRRRARWYCTADDAFLCQACDALVHSANPLARRHERVRLKTSSFQFPEECNPENPAPSWHHGFTRKARTPRQGNQRRKSDELAQDSHSPVPEIGGGETSNEELEELVHRVPIFDPFISQLCTLTIINEQTTFANGFTKLPNTIQGEISQGMGNLCGIHPSDMELDQFAADVDSLLGKGFDDVSIDMETLGLLDCKGKEIISIKGETEMVKVENEKEGLNFVMTENRGGTENDLTRETFELNFDFDSPLGEEEEGTKIGFGGGIFGGRCKGKKNEGGNCNKSKLLRLDYEGVITAWANHRSPWTTGDRPEVDPSDCWTDCLGSCGISSHQNPLDLGDMGGVISGWHRTMTGDDQREARVSRYREKRRTRLFSKKIRYEVRKLNAEKRPRMKGRFVKRTTNAAFAPPANPVFPLLGK